jgi:5-keto 4-deoxyuronate isomerase
LINSCLTTGSPKSKTHQHKSSPHSRWSTVDGYDLTTNFKVYLDNQKTVQHQVGDVLWQPTAGWGIVKCPESDKKIEAYLHLRGEQKKVVAHGFFVNVTRLADSTPMVRECLSALS